MPSNETYRIVYAGSPRLVALGVERCLAGRGHAFVDAGQQSERVTATIERERPDIVLIGPARPRHRSFRLARAVAERWPDLPILLLDRRAGDDVILADAAYIGVCGCLDPEITCNELLDAIRLAIAGRILFTREQLQLAHLPEALTERQAEVLRLAGDGLAVTEIASELNVSQNTVRNHLAEVRSRLGVNTTADAVARAIRRGWLEPE